MSGQLIQIGREIESLVASHQEGILRKKVVTQLSKRYSHDLIEEAIHFALDSIVVQQVLDEPPREPETQKSLVWYLKPLDSKTTEKLKGLQSKDFALMRLLQSQEDFRLSGEIPISQAERELKERGIDYENLQYVRIEDLIDTFFANYLGESVMWVRIIPEYEKTDEFKEAEEEAYQEWAKRDTFRVRMTEELEKDEETRKKRQKKRKKSS